MAYKKGSCYTIYAYIAPDGRMYIGKTGSQQGERAGKNGAGYKHCSRFWNAILRYGWDRFEYRVLATVPKTELDAAQKACDLEMEFICRYRTTNIRFGFNTFAKDKPRSYDRLSTVRKNCRIMNKDGVVKQVPGSEFDNYLAKGWKPGYNRIS